MRDSNPQGLSPASFQNWCNRRSANPPYPNSKQSQVFKRLYNKSFWQIFQSWDSVLLEILKQAIVVYKIEYTIKICYPNVEIVGE